MISKAQLSIISSRIRPVNPLLTVIIILCLFTTGCGFHLNRNRAGLPGGATSISIKNISNQSYAPGLDISLRELLTDSFQQSSITVTSAAMAELSLTIDILSASFSRSTYSYDESGTEYFEFTFNSSARISLTRGQKREMVLIPAPVLSGTGSIKKSSGDLTRTEIEEGREQALLNLRDNILKKLTQNF